MAVRSTNTMQEGLQKILSDIQQLKLLPDVDLPWVIDLETQVISYLRNPVDQMSQQGQLPQDGAPTAGGMPPQVQQPPGGQFAGMPPVGRGVMQDPAGPNPDELRRLLTAGQ